MVFAIIISLFTIFFTDGLYNMLGKSTELDKLFVFSSQIGDKIFFWSPIIYGFLIWFAYAIVGQMILYTMF